MHNVPVEILSNTEEIVLKKDLTSLKLTCWNKKKKKKKKVADINFQGKLYIKQPVSLIDW